MRYTLEHPQISRALRTGYPFCLSERERLKERRERESGFCREDREEKRNIISTKAHLC